MVNDTVTLVKITLVKEKISRKERVLRKNAQTGYVKPIFDDLWRTAGPELTQAEMKLIGSTKN